MVTLVPFTQDQWDPWLEAMIPAYAAGKARAGAWPADEALERAVASVRDLLPDGMATPGHHVRSIVDDDGNHVGVLWYAPADRIGVGSAYIYDFEIFEPFRGRGLGRAALVALEPMVRELGYDAISLSVFGDNDVARALYRSSGYAESSVTMRKRLG